MNSSLSKTGATLLLASLVSACGGSVTGGGGQPEVQDTLVPIERVDAGSVEDRGIEADAGLDSTPTSPLAVELGAAGHFAILSETGVSNVPTSAVTGYIGVSSASSASITGFALSADRTHRFATSSQVQGKVFAASNADPTPARLSAAVNDMKAAFADAAARTASVSDLGAGNIDGMTLTPGVYTWSSDLVVTTNASLFGDAAAVWIFQVGGDLTVSSGSNLFLTGGAVPKNIFWQVSGSVDLGPSSHFEGIVLAREGIALGAGAAINGRLLTQTSVLINGCDVVDPVPWLAP